MIPELCYSQKYDKRSKRPTYSLINYLFIIQKMACQKALQKEMTFRTIQCSPVENSPHQKYFINSIT